MPKRKLNQAAAQVDKASADKAGGGGTKSKYLVLAITAAAVAFYAGNNGLPILSPVQVESTKKETKDTVEPAVQKPAEPAVKKVKKPASKRAQKMEKVDLPPWSEQDDFSHEGVPLKNDRCTIDRIDIMAPIKGKSITAVKHFISFKKLLNLRTQKFLMFPVPADEQAAFRKYFFSDAREQSRGYMDGDYSPPSDPEAPVDWLARKKLLLRQMEQLKKPLIIAGAIDLEETKQKFTRNEFANKFGTVEASDMTCQPSETVDCRHDPMRTFVSTLEEGRKNCTAREHVSHCPKVFIPYVPRAMREANVPLLAMVKFLGANSNIYVNRGWSDVTTQCKPCVFPVSPYTQFESAGFLPQLLMGGAFTSTFPHRHEASIQMNLVGKKRWFVDTRRERTKFSRTEFSLCQSEYGSDGGSRENAKTTLDWLADAEGGYARWAAHGGEEARECTLHAGEIIMVPSEACHAIIDLSDSVSVAYELFGKNHYWKRQMGGR